MVRGEAATALARIRGEESFQWLAKNVGVKHPKVRRAVASALGNFRTPEAMRLLSGLAKGDESYLVTSEALRALGRTRQPGALEALLKLVDRRSWGDVTRVGALDGLAALRDESAVPTVMDRTRYGVPTRGRRAAIAALPRLSDERKVRQHLEELLDDNDPHLRIDVVNAFQTLGDPRARGALRRRLERELDGRVKRRIREALRDMSDSGTGERQRLNDELESVRNELLEMKARLVKLEGAKPDGGRKAKARVATEKSVTKAEAAPRARSKPSKAVRRTRAVAPQAPPKRRKILDERGSRTR
jgi:aminopeptidase N